MVQPFNLRYGAEGYLQNIVEPEEEAAMREIKFREWDRTAKRMIPWRKLQYAPGLGVIIEGLCFLPMQFTGLKDKNGEEIYEGDIVQENCLDKDNVNIGELHVVEIGNAEQEDDTGRIWKWHGVIFKNKAGETCMEVYDQEHCEVIGNIYENPELLENQK